MIKTQVGLFAGKWQAVCGMHMEGGERVSKNQRLDFDLEERSVAYYNQEFGSGYIT